MKEENHGRKKKTSVDNFSKKPDKYVNQLSCVHVVLALPVELYQTPQILWFPPVVTLDQ